MSDYQDYIRGELDRFRDELFEFLKIPSVSASSPRKDDTRAAAEWLSGKLEEAGLSSRIEPTDGHPIVLGEWREAGDDAPTVLVYGHYDVQPAEPLEEWSSEPFDPEVRDGRIYARGSADNKGQIFLHVKALEAHLETHGRLPVNVIVLAEGEEEVGSPNLVPFVEERKDELACDYVVISDSAMFAPGLPSILFSLRGLAYVEIGLRGPASDLHSGTYGGAVENPATALARIIASFHDDDGRIAIPGFYDDVIDWDEETREAIRSLPFDEEEFRSGVGAPALAGEAGYSTLERLWIRPTCEVNGLLSGYTGEGAKTVLPAKSMAKVSCRLVPDQDPGRIADLIREHVERVAPAGVEFEIEELHGGNPWKAELEGPLFDAAKRALAEAFGTEPVLTGEGGSIPIVGEFQRILRAPVLLMGFAEPGCNMHAPDEWIGLEAFERGLEAVAALWDELGS